MEGPIINYVKLDLIYDRTTFMLSTAEFKFYFGKFRNRENIFFLKLVLHHPQTPPIYSLSPSNQKCFFYVFIDQYWKYLFASRTLSLCNNFKI